VSAARYGSEAAARAAAVVRDLAAPLLGAHAPDVAIVLGSGLGGLAARIEQPVVVPFRDVPGFPAATVVGHAGNLLVGRLAGRTVVALAGRFHMYEGHDATLAGFPVRVFAALGARTLVVSNAAGGIRRTFRPGDLMLIADHLNLMCRSPLIGALEPGDLRFPDMSTPYDPALRALASAVAGEQGLALQVGVYAGLLGPSYETPAEVRMLSTLGADAVGMSTVPEVLVARAVGMRVLGISCITNLACGLSADVLSHDEVLQATRAVAARFERLVAGVVERL